LGRPNRKNAPARAVELRPVTEVATHMAHGDAGFTARVYGHVLADAAKRRLVRTEEAIAQARALARTAAE